MNGIPVLHAEGDCVARAWENALIELHKNGCRIKTEYDKPEDPPSIDATMLITIHDPMKEPVIHKDFPGGPEDLQEYTMEVCEGIKDHLVRRADDPEDTRWEYTYHQRLFGYTLEAEGSPVEIINVRLQAIGATERPVLRRDAEVKVTGRAQYADPSSIIKAASMLLNHIGYVDLARRMDMALDICTQFEQKAKVTGRPDGATGRQFAE